MKAFPLQNRSDKVGYITVFIILAVLASSAKWSDVKVIQLRPIRCNPMDYTVHGIL